MWRSEWPSEFRRAHSPLDGVTTAKVRIGSARYPSVVKGQGVTLPDALVPPLTLPLVAQLLITDNLCYSAVYGSAERNTPRNFRAEASSSAPLP